MVNIVNGINFGKVLRSLDLSDLVAPSFITWGAFRPTAWSAVGTSHIRMYRVYDTHLDKVNTYPKLKLGATKCTVSIDTFLTIIVFVFSEIYTV